MLSVSVDVTESGQSYLAKLVANHDEDVSVRMFVLNPGTPEAETCLSYCKPGEEQEDDEYVDFDSFRMYFEARSVKFLEDAKVDFSEDKMGGQLTIRAPNSRTPRVSEDSPVEDKVNYVIWNDINPGLASHGGQVSLREITEDVVAVLEFGGGCQGCSQLDITLRDGVEKTLMDKVSELTGVKDITDHTDASNAYYK